MDPGSKLPNHVVLRVAGQAGADPRTVRKVWRGESVRGGVVVERVQRALAAEGFAPVPSPTPT